MTIRSAEIAKTTTTQTAQNNSYSRSLGKVMEKYLRNIRAMNKATAYEYYFRLTTFQNFITNDYKTTLDNLILRIKEGSEDLYPQQ